MRCRGFESILVGLFAGLLFLATAALRPASAQPDCLVAPEGLVSWWPGDGDALDIEDGNHGTPSNGATFAPGFVGQAFSFDGVDDHVTIPSSASLNALTSAVSVELWFHASSTAAHQILASRVPGAPEGWQLDYTANGGMNFWIGTDAVWARAITSSPSANTWHHAAGTWNGSTVRLYVDGLEVASVAKAGTIDPSAAEMAIGNYNGVKVFPFDGLIDEVSIYDRALTDSEILAIYDAGTAGKCQDDDGDGFRPPADCNDGDPLINPDAVELPGNFVDENCDGNLGDCDPCFPWRNHGEYVRCVSHSVESLVSGGILSEDEGDALVTSAAKSDIGKKGFTPPECP